jgi:hypothetical protein
MGTPPHDLNMSSNQKSNAAHTTLCNEDVWLLHIAEIQLLHEATLQDLIRTRNYTVDKLLCECNQLLREQ